MDLKHTGMMRNTFYCGQVMPEQDELLFAASCADDTDAFSELVSRYQSFIASIAYSQTGDLDRSEEIAQQTFVTAWEKRKSLRDQRRMVAWLAGSGVGYVTGQIFALDGGLLQHL
jgi:hypothetical protein